MQWIIIIIALIAAIPTYGISILVLILIMPYLSAKSRKDLFPPIIREALYSSEVIHVDNIYFEAAERYGEESNNVLSHHRNQDINFYELIDGKMVSVYFSRSYDGKLIVSASSKK